MGSEIERFSGGELAINAMLDHELGAARELAARSRSERTLNEYRKDWDRFTSWADTRNVDPFEAGPEVFGAYVAHLVQAGRKPSTITRALASISVALAAAGRTDHPTRHPVVRAVAAGARRQLGAAQRKARPLSLTDMARMGAALGNSLADRRDRSLLLVGFAAALRRAEIASLAVTDIVEHPAGMEIHLRRSKTDQAAEGSVIPIASAVDPACCPVRAWTTWKTAAQLEDGPAFRSIDRHGNLGNGLSDRAVTLILDRTARRAGLDPTMLSAHSMRAGYITTAAQRGHSERAIANITRHHSIPVLRGYIRRASIWQDAATDLGW